MTPTTLGRLARRGRHVAVWAAIAGLVLVAAPALEAGGIKHGTVRLRDGVTIHYRATAKGPGPTLVFVPGWMMTGAIWEPQLTHFAATRHAVALDPRGQGRSTKTPEGLQPAARARDIKGVIDRLKLAPVVLVGWSMGASEVAQFVDQFGTADLAGLVLVDQSLGGEPNPAARSAVIQWLGDVQADRLKETTAFVRGLFKQPQPEAYLARVTKDAMATPTATAVALYVGSMASSSAAALARIDKPTLIVYASDLDPDPAYVRMQARIAGSRLERIEGAGHALFVDQADRFNRVLDAFVSGLPDGRAAHPR